MNYRIATVPVRGSPMEVFLFAPKGAGPHPGLVLCQHIPVGHTGVENDIVTLRTAERYCDNGYAVAVPFIFHWWPKSADIEVKRAEFRDDDADSTGRRFGLSPRSLACKDHIGIAGHCWGAFLARRLHQPALRGLRRSTAGALLSWASSRPRSNSCPYLPDDDATRTPTPRPRTSTTTMPRSPGRASSTFSTATTAPGTPSSPSTTPSATATRRARTRGGRCSSFWQAN
jgi:hypothetical protein